MSVIHISNEMHLRINGYCQARGIVVREWADAALDRALREGVMPAPKREPTICSGREPAPGSAAEREIWGRPPFWRRRA